MQADEDPEVWGQDEILIIEENGEQICDIVGADGCELHIYIEFNGDGPRHRVNGTTRVILRGRSRFLTCRLS